MRSQLRPALMSFFILTIVTGVIYPAFVTLIARVGFPVQAEGSILIRNGSAQGSSLIGQSFTKPEYFWPRPSATAPVPYAGDAGAGSNLGPSNPALASIIKERVAALHNADPANMQAIPVDLVTASASGLDPQISVRAAEYQIARVARARHLSESDVHEIVNSATDARTWRVLGEPRVNVLQLNLALDSR